MPLSHRNPYHRAEVPWETKGPGAMSTWEAKEIGDTPYQRALRAERDTIDSDHERERST